MNPDERIGFGARISVLQWTALGRDTHTQFIFDGLQKHVSGDFGVPGLNIGFYYEVENTEPKIGVNRDGFRNAYLPNRKIAFCSFKIWRDDAFLSDDSFKDMLAGKFVRAARHFAQFFEKKMPSFESNKYINCIESEMQIYLDSEINVKFSYDDLMIVKLQTGIE